jgi:hypothetical protein
VGENATVDHQGESSRAGHDDEAPWEPVLAPVEYYDGWRLGIAQFCGAPHIFKSEWSEEWREVDLYDLWPLSDDCTAALIEKWREVIAMAEAAKRGANNRDRWSCAWDELMAAFEHETASRPPAAAMYGEFGPGTEEVRWHKDAH